MRRILLKNMPGFTLIELAVVLIIIGIIAAAVLKGQDLLEAAKVRSLLADISRLRLSVHLYQESYGALPGDDGNALVHLGLSNGDGNGIISEGDAKLFWQHLAKAGHLGQSHAPSSKFGGQFSVVYAPSNHQPGHWFRLAGLNQQGVLTPKQANLLKNKADDSQNLVFIDGNNAGRHRCVDGSGQLDLSHTQPSCILLAAF